MVSRKLVIEGINENPHKASEMPLVRVRCSRCKCQLFMFEGEVHRVLEEESSVVYNRVMREILVDEDMCVYCTRDAVYDSGFRSGEEQGWDLAYEDMRNRMDKVHSIKEKVSAAEEAIEMIKSSIKLTKQIMIDLEEAQEAATEDPKEGETPFR